MNFDFMNIYLFIYRLIRRLPFFLRKALFLFSYLFFPVKRRYDIAPLAYLNSVSADKGGSCVCDENKIKVDAKYDVQIIVPVYNVEKYLKECLDSIFNQKTKYKYCVVAVNDGCTDNSRHILSSYANHNNLKIIDQCNCGLSGARNAALKEINAEYVLFVDSDDFLCDNAIELLVENARRSCADIVQGGYSYFWDDGRVKEISPSTTGFCSPQDLFGFAWGKLYKANLWKNIKFPEKYWFEDSVNRLVLFNIAKNAFSIKDNLFMYRQNHAGITISSIGKTKTIDSIWVTKRLIEDYINLGLPITGSVCAIFISQFLFNYSRLLTLNDKKIDYASFLLYRQIIGSMNVDLSFCSYGVKMAYESLKGDDFKKFLLCCFFLGR